MTEKNSYPSGPATVQNAMKDDTDWEMRPCGMLVQKREDDNGADVSSSSPMIAISVTHGQCPTKYKIFLPAQSTFGDIKKRLVAKTGLQPEEQRLLFRGKQKDDDEHLHTAGVKNLSKILLFEDHTSKQRKVVEDVKVLEEVKESNEVSKALEAIADVRSEVDKLSDRVAALKVAVSGGTNVADKEFVVSTELLMRQLLKLDSINAEGEAKMQRKAEVRRVQNFVNTLDDLKAQNSNPISNNHNTVSVTTGWETFESAVGNLTTGWEPFDSGVVSLTTGWEPFDSVVGSPTPPSPAPSSTRVNQDWERFD